MPRRRILAVLASSLLACGKSEPPPTAAPPAAPAPAAASAPPASAPEKAPERKPQDARAMIAAGAVVLDVRSPEEFEGDHLAQATNIPIEDFAQRIAEVEKLTGGDKAKPIVVHCASGKRASKAQAQLTAAGYTHVVNGGGVDDLR